MMNWQTPEQLQSLLEQLVGWESISLSEGEVQFTHNVRKKMKRLPYFQTNPEHLVLGDAGLGRTFLAALTKHPRATKTIVLISHFDTVGIDEYGELAPFAFQPDQLEVALGNHLDSLSEDAKSDYVSGDYLWGRGTMDMKCGLALHMGLMEKALHEDWPINLILLTVPDEEVNSAGMRAAVELLADWEDTKELDYSMFLNGEPVFSMNPTDTAYKVYSGTIGKIMPSALFYGKETHVGEPMSGMTSSLLASMTTRRMEMNEMFQERVYEEATPLPVTLQQKDLREDYTTQTPFVSSALYNVFTMNQTADEVMNRFEEVAKAAASEINEWYGKVCAREQVTPIGDVQVLRYEKLYAYALEKIGQDVMEQLKEDQVADTLADDREKSIQLAKQLLMRCPELAPAIVIMFTPPYYPAVNSTENALVVKCIDEVKGKAQQEFGLPVQQVHYFNGISDLSYVNYTADGTGWNAYEANTPVWNLTYSIPFSAMSKLQAPVLNVGPFGKDAHKRTERLHKRSAFVETPVLIEQVVRTVMAFSEEKVFA